MSEKEVLRETLVQDKLQGHHEQAFLPKPTVYSCSDNELCGIHLTPVVHMNQML